MRLHFEPDDEVEHINSKRRATVIYCDMLKSKLYLRMAFDVEQSWYWICGCGVKNWKERKECRSCIKGADHKQPKTADEIRDPRALAHEIPRVTQEAQADTPLLHRFVQESMYASTRKGGAVGGKDRNGSQRGRSNMDKLCAAVQIMG